MHCKHDAERQFFCAGITLVELLVSLTIVGVLLVLSMPTWSSTLERMRLAKATNDLLSHITLARTESIRTGQRVVVCKGDDELGCRTGTPDWGGGWIVFVDSNRNGVWNSSDSQERLVSSSRGARNVRVFGNTHVRDYVAYSPQGYSRTHTGAFQVGTITLCLTGRSQSTANRIVISRSGRARVERLSALDCPAS